MVTFCPKMVSGCLGWVLDRCLAWSWLPRGQVAGLGEVTGTPQLVTLTLRCGSQLLSGPWEDVRVSTAPRCPSSLHCRAFSDWQLL